MRLASHGEELRGRLPVSSQRAAPYVAARTEMQATPARGREASGQRAAARTAEGRKKTRFFGGLSVGGKVGPMGCGIKTIWPSGLRRWLKAPVWSWVGTPQLSLICKSRQDGAKATCAFAESPAALAFDLRASLLDGRDSPPRGRSCGPALRLGSNVPGAGQKKLGRRWGRMTSMRVIIMIIASMAAAAIISVPIIISSVNAPPSCLAPTCSSRRR
jgi:hypothetical protein